MTDEFEVQQQPTPEPSPPAEPADDLGIGPPPDQSNYDDYDTYLSDKIQYATNKAKAEIERSQRERARAESDAGLALLKGSIKEGVAEAIRPPGPPNPLPDDENWKLRKEAEEWERTYLQKAQKAKEEGNYTEAIAHRDRSRFLWKELEKAPSKAKEVAEEMEFQRHRQAIIPLGELPLDNDPVWQNPKMAFDAGVEIHRHNRDPRAEFLLLPNQEHPEGELMPIRPSNMVVIELPREQMERAQRVIYGYSNTQDPEALSKRAWRFLREGGYHHSAKPTIQFPDRPKAKEEKKETQKEFEEWRTKNNARRF